jgi:hypothetical protein
MMDGKPSRESGVLLFVIGLVIGASLVALFWFATGA